VVIPGLKKKMKKKKKRYNDKDTTVRAHSQEDTLSSKGQNTHTIKCYHCYSQSKKRVRSWSAVEFKFVAIILSAETTSSIQETVNKTQRSRIPERGQEGSERETACSPGGGASCISACCGDPAVLSCGCVWYASLASSLCFHKAFLAYLPSCNFSYDV
jgi:hypothetical protein